MLVFNHLRRIREAKPFSTAQRVRVPHHNHSVRSNKRSRRRSISAPRRARLKISSNKENKTADFTQFFKVAVRGVLRRLRDKMLSQIFHALGVPTPSANEESLTSQTTSDYQGKPTTNPPYPPLSHHIPMSFSRTQIQICCTCGFASATAVHLLTTLGCGCTLCKFCLLNVFQLQDWNCDSNHQEGSMMRCPCCDVESDVWDAGVIRLVGEDVVRKYVDGRSEQERSRLWRGHRLDNESEYDADGSNSDDEDGETDEVDWYG